MVYAVHTGEAICELSSCKAGTFFAATNDRNYAYFLEFKWKFSATSCCVKMSPSASCFICKINFVLPMFST